MQLKGLEDILEVIVGQHHLEDLGSVDGHLALEDAQPWQQREVDEVVLDDLGVDGDGHLFVVVDLPDRASDLHLVLRGGLGFGVVAEEVPAVGLIDVVVLLVRHVDARYYRHHLRNLQNIQLAVLLFDIQEELLIVGGCLGRTEERILFTQL